MHLLNISSREALSPSLFQFSDIQLDKQEKSLTILSSHSFLNILGLTILRT